MVFSVRVLVTGSLPVPLPNSPTRAGEAAPSTTPPRAAAPQSSLTHGNQ